MATSPRGVFCALMITFGLISAANAALIGTLGGTDYQAYYDDESDLMWLADAIDPGYMLPRVNLTSTL